MDTTALLRSAGDPIGLPPVARGYILKAPLSFNEPVWVILPEGSTERPYGPCAWGAIHGAALPATGAACVVVFDEQNHPTVVWWDGEPEFFSVKSFGAIGNGIADDTAAIQRAIVFIEVAGGGTLWFPAGKYYITTKLTIGSFIHLEGENGFWTPGPCEILVGESVMGEVVSITGSHSSITGLSFKPKTAERSIPTINIAKGESVNLTHVYSTKLGGIVAKELTRSKWEDVVMQGWNSEAGFKLITCSIIYLIYCNSAPNGKGTLGEWTYGIYIQGGGTIIQFGSEVNNKPYYGLYISECNDNKFYDIELNGAVGKQLYVFKSNDIQFHNTYCFDAAEKPEKSVQFERSSRIQLAGGWVAGGISQSVELLSCFECQISGLQVSTATKAKGIIVTDDGVHPSSHIQVSGNHIDGGGSGIEIGIEVSGSAGGKNITLSDNIINGTAEAGSKGIHMAASYSGEGISVSGGVISNMEYGITGTGVTMNNEPMLWHGIVISKSVTYPSAATIPQTIWVRDCFGIDNVAEQSAENHTLVIYDAGRTYEMNSAEEKTLTVPTNTEVPFAIGAQVNIYQLGTGKVLIAAKAGVTLRTPPAKELKTLEQFSMVNLRKVAENIWAVTGELA